MVKVDDIQPFLLRVPKIYPTNRCKLRLLKLERTQDWLLLEEEFLLNLKTVRPSSNQNDLKLKTVERIRGNNYHELYRFHIKLNHGIQDRQ